MSFSTMALGAGSVRDANKPSFTYPKGRLLEISGDSSHAHLTLAVQALLQAQSEGETAVWIQSQGGPLYPPDLSDHGINLQALAVVHIPTQYGPYHRLRAAEWVLRSGAAGFVLIDLTHAPLRPHDVAWQGRLLGLAREHDSRVVFLTQSSSQQASLGPLVSLRLAPKRERVSPGLFKIQLQFLKNKMGMSPKGATWSFRGPHGLL